MELLRVFKKSMKEGGETKIEDKDDIIETKVVEEEETK